MRHSVAINDVEGVNRAAAPGEEYASVHQIMRRRKADISRPCSCSLLGHSGGIGKADQLLETARQHLYTLIGLNQATEHLACHHIGDSFKFGNQSHVIVRKIAIIETVTHG